MYIKNYIDSFIVSENELSNKNNKQYYVLNYPEIDLTDVFCIPHVAAH